VAGPRAAPLPPASRSLPTLFLVGSPAIHSVQELFCWTSSGIRFCVARSGVLQNGLIACKEDAFRLHVLRQLAESGTRDGLLLAENLAVSDQRRRFVSWLFHFIFAAGLKGGTTSLPAEVRRQGGWSRELLAVVFRCPEVSPPGWCRRVKRLLSSRTSIPERVELQNMWFQLDPAGAGAHSVSEYEWCRTQCPLEGSTNNEPISMQVAPAHRGRATSILIGSLLVEPSRGHCVRHHSYSETE